MLAPHRHTGPFVLTVLALAVAAVAQQPAGASPNTGKRSATLTDPAAPNKDRAWSDAREFKAEIVDGEIHCTLRMEKPFAEGMFTCVELDFDCDDKSKTGIDGAELLVRAAVGSRFQPNSAEPTNGTMKPIEHLRLSTTTLDEADGGGRRWLHHQLGGSPPVIDGAVMTFRVPTRWIKDRGDRYASTFSFGVDVRTSCSDQPIELLHTCGDQGLPIVLDGKTAEWSGVVAVDPPGELHERLRCVDLTGLRLEHSENRLFVGVDLAEPGFSSWRVDGDVDGKPILTFYVEPLFPRYQEPKRVPLPAGQATLGNDKSPWMAVVGEKTVEAAFERKSGQSRFRVIVHADAEFRDRFAQRVGLDLEAQ